jgi:tRNA threonylcarbamoyladenosine biosynthesis protein TsaB
VLQGHTVELPQQPLRFGVQRLQILVLDAVLTVHLLHQQFAVAEDREPVSAQSGQALQSADQGGVFGDVVGGLTQAARFLQRRFAGARNDEGVRRRARVTASRAVNVDRPDLIAHMHLRSLGLAFLYNIRMQRVDNPKLLLLETSGHVGRVALARGSELLKERTLDETRRHARDLAPAIAALCAEQGWRPRELDAVVVGRGPGSYTGLRVGLMSAKALAYAAGCAVLAVESFAAIARQTPPPAAFVDVLADAQQQLVYVQRWVRSEKDWVAATLLAIRPIAEWLATLEPEVWVSGPGLNLCEAQLAARNPAVATEAREPIPRSLLELGLRRWREGAADDLWSLEPLYLRPSNAEENWAKRQ